MKTPRILSIFAVAFFCLSASTSFATLINVQTKVVQLWPREWGFHIVIEPAASASLAGLGLSCNAPQYPVWLLGKPDYKTTKDALFLAYTLNRSVRIHLDTTPPAGEPLCYGSNYPRIYAIDVLEN